MVAESALIVFLFVVIHVAGSRFGLPSGPPRSSWLSAAGGLSVAYVFLHLLPELHEGQTVVSEAPLLAWMPPGAFAVYMVALIGLAAFYGLERLAALSRRDPRGGTHDRTSAIAFRAHIGAFAAYNLLISYLLVRDERDSMLLYGLALGLHFVVNDHALREHHRHRYDETGRWLLAAALLAGWVLGLFFAVPPSVVHLLIALLAGAMILNVLKEELPRERESRFIPFAAGATAYGAILLAV